ncbi:MAG TPA: ribonuclease Y [Synergistaceae bacterium]|jgi:ribonuclease Y|nr:MAG: Ribonuclease Y [Synergistales bacterium 53_16]KUL05299.1 MAG: Ribonuclease Y [Synergistales bacterium 54_9]MDK2845695.1 ribonucrease [Synergistales bacterium]HAA47377.1 ribonuclease Y [Synergistaceae bacterium]MDN5335343.1 ribonucrease [Synergistales bacterium]
MLPVVFVSGIAIGIVAGFLLYRLHAKRQLKGAQDQADKLIKEAFQEAEQRKREMLTEAKEEILHLRQDAEKEIREQRSELQRAERRLEQKEENLDKRLENLQKKEDEHRQKQEELRTRMEEVETLRQEQLQRLEKIAAMTREEAREHLLKEVEEEASHIIGLRIKELEEKAKREAEKRSREIVVSAIQRCAVDHTSEMSVSVVNLPSDEMKGRIIGREGRNIRAFETFTGVDLIVDDTPEAVTLSSFDPVRREVARISLEKLVLDGRIHPARIEEIIEKSQKEVEEMILDAGEEALLETGIKTMHPELVKLIGQLRFRSSYGQNALNHSLEVAHVAGIMAAELNLDETIARRAGLLHDIGKAVDHQVEGPHALIGRDLARRYGEAPEIVSAIASHHEDEEMTSVYDVLIAAADAVSASRPGARRESLDSYIKRLEKLESLAKTFKGVSKAYAIQAGREIRVMVAPNITDDGTIQKMAYDIARKIEDEMKYPGQIKVVVVRETRSVEYAR